MPKILLVKVGHKTARQKFGQPLGIMYLAGFLRKFMPDAQVELIDMLPEALDLTGVMKRVGDFSPDLLGVSALSFESAELHELAALVKKTHPKIPIIAGGPYVTTATNTAFADQNLDFVARCEGEQTLLELCNFLFRGQGALDQIPGLGFREKGGARINPDRPFQDDLDALPFPAWDLIKVEKYFDLPRFGTTYVHKEYMSVMTSRGCPFKCTYCHRVFGVGFRPRSPENVIAELELLQKNFGVREIFFVDDCFNCKPGRAKEICELILKKGLKFSITFPNGLRGDMMDEELLDKLKAAGTYRITYAVETASERLQKFLKKNLNLEKVKNIIEQTDRRDILVDAFFMVGFPGETRAEVMQTLDFAINSKLHSMNIWFVTPFEGTELYEQAKELGYELKVNTDRFTYFFPETTLSEIPPNELNQLAQKTFLKFYLNPWRLWRIFKLFPNKAQLPYLLWLFIKYSLKWS
jgi:anaerobic magnesium-protoporphyrin IX monomethyl ester cyclase